MTRPFGFNDEPARIDPERIDGQRGEDGKRAQIFCSNDAWADARKGALPNRCYLLDMDGAIWFDYATDNWANRDSLVREHGVVALFDRKSCLEATEAGGGSTAFYLWLAKIIRDHQQGIAPKFFYIFGSHGKPPWAALELDIDTGRQVGELEPMASPVDFRRLWTRRGLLRIRDDLKRLEALR